MSGSNQSVNLQGMLGDIASTVGDMGKAYDFIPNAIREVARPEVDMNDSTSLESYASWARRNGYDEEADKYLALSYRQKEKEAQEAKAGRLQMGRSSVASLQNEYMRVLKDPTITDPKVRDKKLANLQASMNAIGAAVEGMDPIRVGQIGQQTKAADLQARAQEQEMALAQERNERAWGQFDLGEEESARAAERHAEWQQTQDYRVEAQELELEAKQYQAAVNAAKGLIGQEGGREKFIAAFGEERAGAYDSLNQQREAQELQLQEARAVAAKNKWTYTDEELKDMGISEAVIPAIQKAGQNRPQLGHQAVEAVLLKQFETAEMPTSAVLGLFKDAALAHVQQNVDLKGRDTEEKQDAEAGRLALKMAERYLASGGSIEEALKEVTAYQVGGEENQSEIDRQLELIEQTNAAALAQMQDNTDPDR
jgi:hypothetical protein